MTTHLGWSSSVTRTGARQVSLNGVAFVSSWSAARRMELVWTISTNRSVSVREQVLGRFVHGGADATKRALGRGGMGRGSD